MRAIILSWEYPPRVVGQLAEHVKTLTTQLANNKVETYVVTYDESQTGQTRDSTGVSTFRVNNPVHTHIGVLTWVLTLNQEIERAAATIYYDAKKQVDLINVFDWHFIPAAVALKNGLGLPFIFSVESLEDHRSPTAVSSYNLAIKSIEWLGFFEAQGIWVKSEWMKEEVMRIHQVPAEKITVISAEASGWINDVLKLYKHVAETKA
jgi:glycogen synthase